MSKKYFYFVMFVLLSIVFTWVIRFGDSCKQKTTFKYLIASKLIEKPLVNFIDTLPIGLVKLKEGYPEFVKSVGRNFLVCKDGTKIIYDDGKNKSNYDVFLNKADLQDQMKMNYKKGRVYEIPSKNFDPGRVRNEVFFRKMYGNTKKEVLKNLVTINWLPSSINKKLKVTKINRVDLKLKAISEELDKIPHLKKYLDNPGGSFYWRKIAGTQRLSMHSFGAAIDINVKYSNYWKWSKNQKVDSIPYINKIPLEIVEIFEKHGFIWGGKWYHYDTMHFEYRPELF